MRFYNGKQAEKLCPKIQTDGMSMLPCPAHTGERGTPPLPLPSHLESATAKLLLHFPRKPTAVISLHPTSEKSMPQKPTLAINGTPRYIVKM